MDFDNGPAEEQNASDIDSEKDVFNDETFGVDVDDLEGNEFDFTTTQQENPVPPQITSGNYPPQVLVNKHTERQALFTARNDSGDSDDFNEPNWNKPQLPQHGSNHAFTQNHQSAESFARVQFQGDRRTEHFGQSRQPQYFRQEDEPRHQPQYFRQEDEPRQQQAFRMHFNSLSLSSNDQGNVNNDDDEANAAYQRQLQNQSQNVSFQPFSFAQNGYRRPQWDEDGDNGNQYQQRNFQQRNYYQNNGQGQPQYFRNRQQQGWQQRDHYGGYQRHYQRHDDHDDRGHGRWQHREYRHFERRGPSDPWAGLMTWREKLTVLRIQLLQIISDRGSHFDDYYARMVAEKRKAQSARTGNTSPTAATSANVEKVTTLSGDESSDNESSGRVNDGSRRRLGVEGSHRRRTVSASTDGASSNANSNTRNRIPIPRLSVVDVQPYKPLAFQGTLGKWTTTTVTRPRQIIDCSAMLNLEDLQESGRKGESTAKLLRQALGCVERLYDFVLNGEELERLLKQGPITSDIVPEGNAEGALRVGSFQSTNMPKPVDPVELESQLSIYRRDIALTLCAPTRLALILAIRKGRKILPRALKILDRARLYLDAFELSLQLASVLCEHLPLLIRRESNAAALVAVVTPLCSFVKGVIITTNAMPTPVKSEDFLFTVRHILADKALSTRSPELVTLLASLVHVKK